MGIFRDIKIVYFIFLFVLCLNVFVIFMYIYKKEKRWFNLYKNNIWC